MDVTKTVRAAGGVVWRRTPVGRVELALVHRPAYDDWSFPKGKLDADESERSAALREVEEETGLRGSLGRDLGVVSYIDGRGRPKTVRYWEMEIHEGSMPKPANEVDEVRWVALALAGQMLTYEHDRALLDRFGVTV